MDWRAGIRMRELMSKPVDPRSPAVYLAERRAAQR
jgi:hypothetical protein